MMSIRPFRRVAPVLFLLACFGCSTTPGSQSGGMPAVPVTTASSAVSRDGTAASPLRLMLLPAEGAAADRAIANTKPLLDVVTADTGLHFDIKIGDSYAAVVEALASGHAELAYLGPFTYLQARQRGAAELLATAVQKDGRSVYYSGVFCRKDSGIKKLTDLKGHSVAFGSLNSTSAFNYPCAMLLAAGIDPARDLSKIYIVETHAAALSALATGNVDAACASTGSFETAVTQGMLDPAKFTVLAQSEPIPGSPIAMHPSLPAKTKALLRQGFAGIYKSSHLTADALHAEDGRKLQKYDTHITDADYDRAAKYVAPVTDDLKQAMLRKASQTATR